jgi:hypothetical protein
MNINHLRSHATSKLVKEILEIFPFSLENDYIQAESRRFQYTRWEV